MMRAADVGGERRLRLSPMLARRAPHPRSDTPPPAAAARSRRRTDPAIEQIDGLPANPRRVVAQRRAAWPMPRDDPGAVRAAADPGDGCRRTQRAPVTRVGLDIGRVARQRGTPLSAPLNGEKLPRPASVNDKKNRWSDGDGREAARREVVGPVFACARPQHWAL